ncbi:MAG: hypothetical protein GY846_14460 [Deltaproteobacteria bacterium]|nr:hypothetical protein [Deltaproteobacteria bacterium]
MAKIEVKKPPMDPEEYKAFLKEVELSAIVLDACSTKTNRNNIGSNMRLDIIHKANYKISKKNEGVISSSYDLTVTKSTKKDFALKLKCVYQVQLISEKPLLDDFMEIFTKVNTQMNTWPYFREFAQSMFQRAGFPALTLPLLKR